MAMVDERPAEPPVPLDPMRHAAIGLVLAVPMTILLAAVILRVEPLEAAMRAAFVDENDRTNLFGNIFAFGSLVALPVALAVSLWPVIRDSARDARRHLYIANIAVAAVILALIIPSWGALADEIYRCDIARIPNCD